MGLQGSSDCRRMMTGALRALAVLLFMLEPLSAALAAGGVRNITQGSETGDLAQALAAARDGDVIELSGGPYVGNFVIDRALTLRSGASGRVVLDGGGSGSVLTIRAAGATVENLALRNSGRTDNAFAIWGDAGVAVRADRAVLDRLEVTGNDWGVLFFPGAGSRLSNSDVSDNARDGVRIMGGRDHVVEGNTINRNALGVSIDTFYPEPVSPVLLFADPAVVKQFAEYKEKSPISSGNLVRANEVRGNGFYGVSITWESTLNRIEDNRVFLTGRERQVDEAIIAAWQIELARISGIAVAFDRDPYGSGISLFCLASENVVSGNEIRDNLAFGVILDLVNRNTIRDNAVRSNRSGIVLSASDANEITRNTVSENGEYGIRVGAASVIKQPPADNLIALNDLAGNPVNAFDTSGRTLTAADFEAIVETLPLPPIVKEQMAKNPMIRTQMIQAYLANLKPASNRWDDGTHGNRHDDFDEVSEGFVDRDGDGISEAPKPIPGGPGVDRHPLNQVALSAA